MSWKILVGFLQLLHASAFACGGGEPIVLNDIALLHPHGISFELPAPGRMFLIEDIVSIFGSIPTNKFEIRDSAGRKTHEVMMSLEGDRGTYAVYVVTDLAGTIRTYRAPLTARGCGLEEVKPGPR